MPRATTPARHPTVPASPPSAASAAASGLRRLRPLAWVIALAWPAFAPAQSLLDLYQAARGFDATYLAARAQADSAQYRAAQADALVLPSVGIDGSSIRTYAEPPDLPQRQGTTTQLVISGKQPLFNRANSATRAQAARSLEAAGFDLASAEQDLIVRVAQAYFDVLGAQDTLATTRASKAAISEQLASAKRNFEVGTATITDTREAQARFDLATAQELAADNDLSTKRATLDQLVGRSQVSPLTLATPVVLPGLPSPQVDDWLQRADAQHPQVRKAQLGLDIARLETDKARAGHLPTVDAVASVGTNRANGNLGTSLVGTTNSASIGVQLSMPLFAGFATQNRVKETLALEEKARNDLEFARRTVAVNTRTAFLGLQSGQSQVKALEAAESSSLLALEATQLGYRVGVRVNLDVLNAQTQLYTTRRDLAKARYDLLLVSLKLRQASGQLGTEDLAAVDRLLAH